MMLNGDSSPFQSSPFNASDGNSSPRLFWQGRDPTTPNRFNSENLFGGSARESSPSPTRRSSIERLQRASRVKNSNMFAREQKQEYDPASVPVVERPLAKQLQGNAYGGSGLEGLRSADRHPLGHHRNDSRTSIPLYSPALTKTPLKNDASGLCSPSKDQISPTKSSMSSRAFKPKSSFDPENDTWSENSGDERELPPGRTLHRHAKSVTFDAAPPQVNEYEMATPDLSSIGTGSRENSYDSAEEEEEESYICGDSAEQEDSFDASLEDTDKTPVVGPEDWRHASPGPHNNGIMSGRVEDLFEGPEGSPMPDARPSSSANRPAAIRNDSLNSNGEHRPLPPLPGMRQTRSNSNASTGLSAAAERATNSQRNLPSPPAASSVSKSEIQGMDSGKMSLEERLRLMMIQDDDKPKTQAESQRERRMRRGGPRDRSSQTPEKDHSINIHEDEVHEDEDTLDDLVGLGTYKLPPRISRESILRKVNGSDPYTRESDYNFSSPAPSSSPERAALPDPDIPIPSTENTPILETGDDSVMIKAEPEDDEVDVYSITEMYHNSESRLGDDEYDESVVRHDAAVEDDVESQYSDPTPSNRSPQLQTSNGLDDSGPPTPRAKSPVSKDARSDPVKEDRKASLPEFPGLLDRNDFGLSLQSYMTSGPLPEDGGEHKPSRMSMADAHEYLRRASTPEEQQAPLSRPEYDGSGWGPEEEDQFEVGTPDSVIRHPVPPSPARDSPSIPEHVATIKSFGSKLKTRPSATPSDIMAMQELRRNISGEQPSIPPIPERHHNRPSLSLEPSEDVQDGDLARKESFKKKSLTLDIGGDLGLGLDTDFDRVIEAQKVAFDLSLSQSHSQSQSTLFQPANGQASNPGDQLKYEFFANVTPRKQRGYLMRQNTKVVVASSNNDKGTRSAGNSPVKKDRPQSWVVEPWNGQMRKSSVRGHSSPRKTAGPVPPMPGHESNVTGLGIVTEDVATTEPATEEGGERGRLFVKVIGVKDLDMPLPKSKLCAIHIFILLTMNADEQTWFSLTLDNGVHCVTTAWLELGRNAPIGQEFELVVPNELEFQLTLNAKLVKPAPKRVATSPTKAKAQKPSTFSRVFASPKKRKELEMRQREEEQRIAQENQRNAQASKSSQPTTWDLLSPLTAEDGSFGRSYVCLKDHETRCYGRPYVADVACFNEWATEEVGYSSSIKSKRGNTNVQRRAPYKVAKLEIQLLFVPKPKGATDDEMPKSLNACIREMKEAELAVARNWEGHLSQQGGDCPVSLHFYLYLFSLLTPTVLASSLLQAHRQQTHRLPRSHAPTPRNHQPRQRLPPNRRPPRPHAEGNRRQRRQAPQIRLRRRRGGLHVRRGGIPHPLQQRRGHRLLRRCGG